MLIVFSSSQLGLDRVNSTKSGRENLAKKQITNESTVLGTVRGQIVLSKKQNSSICVVVTKLFQVSIIGLRFVVQPSSSMGRRLVWIALILAGTCFTIFQIQDRISFYFSWPTNVGIRVEHVESMRFPTVTICNENRAMKSVVEAWGKI